MPNNHYTGVDKMKDKTILSDKQPTLSIIVPVYNVEKYIEECLDSLINQDASADSYEIICIDDGSPDNCGQILDEYAKNHSNLTVIHQKNTGLAGARNAGLKTASGKYIWFVDSDDFIPQYAVRLIVKEIAEQSAEVFWIGMHRFTNNTIKYNDEDIDKFDSNIKLRSCYSVKSIKSKDFLEKNGILFFDEKVSQLAEDYLLHFKVMKCHPTEGVVTEKPLYFYRYVSSSISNTLSQESIRQRVNVWKYVLEVQKSYFSEEGKKDRIMTALEMQDAVKGIFHWLSLLTDKKSDCFSASFAKEYLPYLFNFTPICFYINLRAFFFRRIISSYNHKNALLFRLYISAGESDIIKKTKKRIKNLIRKIR